VSSYSLIPFFPFSAFISQAKPLPSHNPCLPFLQSHPQPQQALLKIPLQEWTALVFLFFPLPLQLLLQSNRQKKREHQHAGQFRAVRGGVGVGLVNFYRPVVKIRYYYTDFIQQLIRSFSRKAAHFVEKQSKFLVLIFGCRGSHRPHFPSEQPGKHCDVGSR